MELTLLFLGAIVSAIAQLVKKYAGTSALGSVSAVLGLSIIGGLGLWYLKAAGFWEAALQILAYAGAVYAFIIKNWQDANK